MLVSRSPERSEGETSLRGAHAKSWRAKNPFFMRLICFGVRYLADGRRDVKNELLATQIITLPVAAKRALSSVDQSI